MELKGTKIVEVPYFESQIEDITKDILIIGEKKGGVEGVSETIHKMGCTNVSTTDILESPPNSWLRLNTTWKHIQCDFIKFDEKYKFNYIISISVFEHFGFWFAGDRMADGLVNDDNCKWNHDIRGINKACNLLKDQNSKLIITLPAGPYMNYEETGEPFLRAYDWRRREIIINSLKINGYYISDESFYHSSDYENWNEVSSDILKPKYYHYYNSTSPNVIWAFTVQKIK